MNNKIENLLSAVAPSDEVKHLRNKNKQLEAALKKRQRDSGQIAELMAEVLELVPHAKPVPIRYKPSKNVEIAGPVTHVLQVTDWHIGEYVPAASVEGFGGTDWATAQARVAKFSTNVVKNAQMKRSAYQIDTCQVLGTADWVSGGIHEELKVTNEFPEPVQAVNAGFLLGRFVESLAPHYNVINVDVITAGNHDRLTRKPQSADGGLNSWGYVVCMIAREYLKRLPNVRFTVHAALNAIVDVGGQRYLISHGDGIMGTWGIPFYGIERKKQREAMARMNMPIHTHFDKIVIGHFHAAVNHLDWLIGGSLSGTTEHDHKAGRHSKPHQTAWFVHPQHGEFDWSRWEL
jgi:hypothetical protein